VAGSTPVYVDQRPLDGVTYYYRIAHALGGRALSSYTPEVSAIPAGVPRDVFRPDAVAPIVLVTTSETATTATVTLGITDPQNRLIQVRFREQTNGGGWSGWVVDTGAPYTYSATIPSSGFVQIEYEVTAYGQDGIARIVAGGVESFDANTTPDMVSVVGTFNNAGAFTLAISADSDTASIKYAISTVGQPTLGTVQAQSPVNGRNITATFAGPYASGTTVFVSVLGYTGAGGTGSESALFEYRFVRDGGIVYSECLATMLSSSATQIAVQVFGTATTGSPTVQLVAITGSATLASGAAIGVPVGSGSTWLFNRGTALGQPGGAQFRAVLAGTQSDDDFIEIPEQGRDTVTLASRARVLTTTDTTVTVRYAVADPFPQGANTVQVTYQNLGTGGVTPASGGFVTPEATLTENAGTFIDYTITRPAFQAGTGRVTFTANATAGNRVSDSDAVDIPAQERDTTYLSARARVTATTATQVTVRVAVLDKYTALTSTIAYVAQGTGTVTPGSGGTVTAAVGDTYLFPTEAAGSFIDYTIDRPAFQAGTGRVTYTVTATGRVAATDAVDIPAQERDTTYLTLRARTITSSETQMVVRVAALDRYSALSTSLAYATTGLASVTPASPQTVTAAVGTDFTTPEAAGSFADFTIARPAAGAASGTITFSGTATGRVTDAVVVTIPAQDVAIMTLTGSFNDAGTQATIYFTGDSSVASFKFATSTSAFPALATVQAQTAINARVSTQTVSGTFTLGTTLFVSCVTYTGTSGTGRESPIFQLAIRRQNTAPTIKNRQPGNAVCYPATATDEFTRSIGHYVPGPKTGTRAGSHYGQVIVPRGVTLRAVRVNCYALQAPSGGGPGDTISVNFYRQSDNGGTTFLGFTAQNLYAGWQTLGVTSLSEDTTDRSYFMQFDVTWNTAPPSSSDLEIAWLEAEYDKPNTDTNI